MVTIHVEIERPQVSQPGLQYAELSLTSARVRPSVTDSAEVVGNALIKINCKLGGPDKYAGRELCSDISLQVGPNRPTLQSVVPCQVLMWECHTENRCHTSAVFVIASA